ncbi:hypothetical protein Nos7524_3977 [Nostoc sp. PCC 7524]|uniref:caspase family protein n=1 Tax=Nostoc sp. (strain ATCC 29411 / PCC 7524) TaxID=28072 RepID=UPI00029F4A38|nr:caspase family protein [Nostoc sp. PCC 7524]AFY49750.1 hypothetical protein Nos7524_3977 [Nostoc sp. PCC 7524]
MAKLALLIGVSEYEPGLNPLPASVKDVLAIAQVLQHPEMCGFAEADIQKLENPDPQKMHEAIETLFCDRRKDDLILLYFSGHGIKDETGKLYLATRLTRKNPQGRLVKATAVPANFIHNIMSESRSKRQVVILDCCFSGAFAEGLSAKDDGSVDIHTQLGGEGRVILTSSTSTQYSFQQEGDNLSIYTRYVVEGIETGAADQDNDGVISIDELHEYAKKKVKEAAPAMQPEIYAVKEGFKIRLAKAPIGDPKLRYRQEVERFASRGVISAIGRSTLDLKRQSLGLLPEEATAIEIEVLKPYQEYQKRLQRYEQVLVEEINKQYPFDQNTRNELITFQQALGLKEEDIQPILARVVPKKIQPEIKPKNNSQRSIWNGINVGVGIFILAGGSSWIVINMLVKSISNPSKPPFGTASKSWCLSQKESWEVFKQESIRASLEENNCQYWGIILPTTKSETSPPSPSPTESPEKPADNKTKSEPPFGTAPKSWCLSQKQLWEFFKNNSGRDDESIRASMEERNCSYWKITLPKPQPYSSAQPNLETLKIPSLPKPKTSLQPSFGNLKTPLLPPLDNSLPINNSHQGTTLLPKPNVSIPSQSLLGTTETAEKMKTDAAAKLSCVQDRDRYKALVQQGAMSEQSAKNALNAKNCSDFGINWP